MATGSRHMARRSALQALYQQELTGVDIGIADNFLEDWKLKGVDRDYFKQLVFSIPTCTKQLDVVLEQCLDGRDLASVDPIERVVLRLGVYELQFRPEIPIRVILNEAIELTREFGAEEGYRFVNGVLDRCQELCRNEERSHAP